MMTPISRLIPTGSSPPNARRPSERETARLVSGPGTGSMTPMRPVASNNNDLTPVGMGGGGSILGGGDYEQRGDDIVNDILRDVERGRGSSGDSIVGDYDRGESGLVHGSVNHIKPTQRAPPVPQPPLTTAVHFQDPVSYTYREHDEESLDLLREPNEAPAKKQKKSQAKQRKDENDDENADEDFLEMLLKEIKLPLIVAVLILLMGISQADDMLGKFIPTLLVDGRLGYGGLIAKAVVGGLIYYAVQRIFL